VQRCFGALLELLYMLLCSALCRHTEQCKGIATATAVATAAAAAAAAAGVCNMSTAGSTPTTITRNEAAKIRWLNAPDGMARNDHTESYGRLTSTVGLDHAGQSQHGCLWCLGADATHVFHSTIATVCAAGAAVV